jgi:hypothetical protein
MRDRVQEGCEHPQAQVQLAHVAIESLGRAGGVVDVGVEPDRGVGRVRAERDAAIDAGPNRRPHAPDVGIALISFRPHVVGLIGFCQRALILDAGAEHDAPQAVEHARWQQAHQRAQVWLARRVV